jgi:hypothetical protein
MLNRFLALTGIEAEPRSARRQPNRASSPAFSTSCFAHEPSLMAFCNETETDPEVVSRAREQLMGNPGNEWLST